MKIRTDFITNSSSSAFVVIGVYVKDEKDYNDMYKQLRAIGFDYFSEEGVVGKVIAKLDLDDYTSVNKNFSEIQTVFEEVKYALNQLGIDKEIKLIADIFAT